MSCTLPDYSFAANLGINSVRWAASPTKRSAASCMHALKSASDPDPTSDATKRGIADPVAITSRMTCCACCRILTDRRSLELSARKIDPSSCATACSRMLMLCLLEATWSSSIGSLHWAVHITDLECPTLQSNKGCIAKCTMVRQPALRTLPRHWNDTPRATALLSSCRRASVAGTLPGQPQSRRRRREEATMAFAIERPELAKNNANYVPLSPISFLARAASFFPERSAVIHGDLRFTYGELYARCRRLAHALQTAGIGRGDTVAIMATNTPAMLEAHYAVPMLGAVLNPINIRLDPAAIAFCLEHGEAKVLLADREFHAQIKSALELLQGARSGDRHRRCRDRRRAQHRDTRIRGFHRRGRPGIRLSRHRRRVGKHLPALHVRHHRQSEGRGVQSSRRASRRHVERADLQARPPHPVPVDAADVPLLGLDLYLGRHRRRRHACVPAQGRPETHFRADRRAPCHPHVRRADRADDADPRARRAQAQAAGPATSDDRRRGAALAGAARHGGDGLRRAARLRHHRKLWAVAVLRPRRRLGRQDRRPSATR